LANPGHRLTGDGIRKIVVRHSENAGIKKQMSPHRIRHLAITATLDATDGDVRKVQKLSRHRNLNTLMIYDDNRSRDSKILPKCWMGCSLAKNDCLRATRKTTVEND
jgi:integrase/recombinase XerC